MLCQELVCPPVQWVIAQAQQRSGVEAPTGA